MPYRSPDDPGPLYDVAVDIRASTAKAYKVWDGVREVWVPKSQVESNPDGTMTMPEWLAREKGFI